MLPAVVNLSWVLLFATEAIASCAHGTHLFPRQEATVEVNNFGYIGLTVSDHTHHDPFKNRLCNT